jgi:hypothetical protein
MGLLARLVTLFSRYAAGSPQFTIPNLPISNVGNC